MTNIEHLVENGISHLISGGSHETFLDNKFDRMMLDMVATTRDELWLICQYVVYVLLPSIAEDNRSESEWFDQGDLPVFCDEVTGYVGQWLERDTSSLPKVAVQHLQDAYTACAEALSDLKKKPDFTNHPGDDYPN